MRLVSVEADGFRLPKALMSRRASRRPGNTASPVRQITVSNSIREPSTYNADTGASNLCAHTRSSLLRPPGSRRHRAGHFSDFILTVGVRHHRCILAICNVAPRRAPEHPFLQQLSR